jgi:predicted outer membrane repeat protein
MFCASQTSGGGLYVQLVTSLELRSQIQVEANTAVQRGGGIYIEGGGNILFAEDITVKPTIELSYCVSI